MSSSKDWIDKAIKKPGSFSAAAKRAGKSTAEYAEEHDENASKLDRRARLAQTLMALRKKKG